MSDYTREYGRVGIAAVSVETGITVNCNVYDTREENRKRALIELKAKVAREIAKQVDRAFEHGTVSSGPLFKHTHTWS